MKMPYLSGLLFASLLSPVLPAANADEVVVYSSRKEHLIKPLFDKYTEQSGVKIRYITDNAGPLLQRLQAEGGRTPADVLITVDAGNLWQAAERDLLAESDSAVLRENVPSHLRDTANRWFALSVRARTLAYNTERVSASELSSYEDLADPKWKGRLCLRTSKKVYNQSLVATMIARHGEPRTEQIVSGWVDNLATAPFSNDTKALEAVASGQCDVTIVNTYYFGRLMNKKPELKLSLFWPNQASSGVHINVSGAGITKHAPHPAEALKLIEWLSSEQAQVLVAGLNMEYPVHPNVPADAVVASWGEFKGDQLNVSEAGRLQAAAIRLMDRSGYR